MQAGDLTAKFWALRAVVGRYLALPALPPGLTNVTEKGSYGRVNMELAATLWSSIDTLATTRSGMWSVILYDLTSVLFREFCNVAVEL